MFWRVYTEHEKFLWDWAVEEAYEGWKDSDTPYETFACMRVDWEHSMEGRGGGHLCMTECAGIDLECSPEDLEEKLMEREPPSGAYVLPHWKVRDLFIICVQNSVDLTTEKVSGEVEYRAAWRLWVSFCEDEVKTVISEYENRERLSEDAGKIMDALDEKIEGTDSVLLRTSFKNICALADVKIDREG